MKDYLISIIIPVYNCDKYIKRCLDSVLNNTYKNIEIIVINDGSTDNSDNIIKKYNNIIYKKTKNYGVSHARNLGISLSKGDFILFLDSDDYIREDAIEQLVNYVKDNGSDIVCFSYKKEYKDSFVIKSTNKIELYNNSLKDKNELLVDIVPYAAVKLFNRNLIIKNDIYFDEDLKIFEDLLFTYKVCKNAKKIGYLDEVIYYYNCSNENSATRYFSDKMFDIFISLDRLRDYYGDFCINEIDYISLKHISLRFFEKTKNYNLKKKYINESFYYFNDKCHLYKDNIYFNKSLKNRVKTSKCIVLLISYFKYIMYKF